MNTEERFEGFEKEILHPMLYYLVAKSKDLKLRKGEEYLRPVLLDPSERYMDVTMYCEFDITDWDYDMPALEVLEKTYKNVIITEYSLIIPVQLHEIFDTVRNKISPDVVTEDEIYITNKIYKSDMPSRFIQNLTHAAFVHLDPDSEMNGYDEWMYEKMYILTKLNIMKPICEKGVSFHVLEFQKIRVEEVDEFMDIAYDVIKKSCKWYINERGNICLYRINSFVFLKNCSEFKRVQEFKNSEDYDRRFDSKFTEDYERIIYEERYINRVMSSIPAKKEHVDMDNLIKKVSELIYQMTIYTDKSNDSWFLDYVDKLKYPKIDEVIRIYKFNQDDYFRNMDTLFKTMLLLNPAQYIDPVIYNKYLCLLYEISVKKFLNNSMTIDALNTLISFVKSSMIQYIPEYKDTDNSTHSLYMIANEDPPRCQYTDILCRLAIKADGYKSDFLAQKYIVFSQKIFFKYGYKKLNELCDELVDTIITDNGVLSTLLSNNEVPEPIFDYAMDTLRCELSKKLVSDNKRYRNIEIRISNVQKTRKSITSIQTCMNYPNEFSDKLGIASVIRQLVYTHIYDNGGIEVYDVYRIKDILSDITVLGELEYPFYGKLFLPDTDNTKGCVKKWYQ